MEQIPQEQFFEQSVRDDDSFGRSGPPRLEYELRTKKLRIAFFWSMILLDSMGLPIVLYFVLWKGTPLSHSTVYNIISATLAGTCFLEFFQRLWFLAKKNSTCAVVGAKRYWLDSFQYIFALSLLLVVVIVIVGGIPANPRVRVLAMLAPAFTLMTGLELLVIDTLYFLGVRAPIRLSSIPRGGQMKPAVYLLIEDVIAVDGGGGTEFRERLARRYGASIHFRRMLNFLSIFWWMGALIVGSFTAVLVLVTDLSIGYVIGWVVPFIWASIWIVISFQIVRMELKIESRVWRENEFKRQRALRNLE